MTTISTGILQHSTDLADVMETFYQAIPVWNSTAAGRFVSREEFLGIGTDPEEWITDYETFDQLFAAQARAMPGMAVAPSALQAFVEGTVGWAADRPVIRLPDGTEISARMTAIFHWEDGTWKMVHTHWSMGQRNEEALGAEVTEAIDHQMREERRTS